MCSMQNIYIFKNEISNLRKWCKYISKNLNKSGSEVQIFVILETLPTKESNNSTEWKNIFNENCVAVETGWL